MSTLTNDAAMVAAVAGTTALTVLTDEQLGNRIAEIDAKRKENNGKMPPEFNAEYADLKALQNRRSQIRLRDESRASLKAFKALRGNAVARRLVAAMAKETVGVLTKDDPELKKRGTVEQVSAYAKDMASLDGLVRLEKTFNLIRECVKAGPALSNRGVLLEGNLPGIDVVLSTFGVRVSSKAADSDIDASINAELRDEAGQ